MLSVKLRTPEVVMNVASTSIYRNPGNRINPMSPPARQGHADPRFLILSMEACA